MAATLDVVMLSTQPGRPTLVFAHAGTSTIAHLPHDETELKVLTTRHAYGDSPPLRAAGITPDLVADTGTVPVRPGDRILLCTDGLGGLDPAELHEAADHPDLQEAVEMLMTAVAMLPGGSDATALLAEVVSD